MKKLLFMTYHFPPIGGPAVQPIVKFVKYIKRYNWDLVVFTSKGNVSGSPVDYSLLKEIPDSTKVYRKRYQRMHEFIASLPFLWRGRNYFGKIINFPDVYVWWALISFPKLCRVIRLERPDAIYIIFPPFSLSLIVPLLKLFFRKIPLVIDFRDPWSFSFPIKKTLFFWQMRFVRCFEKIIDRLADRVIVDVSLHKKQILENFHIRDNKIMVVPNGYDEEDFRGIRFNNAIANEKLNIYHIGTFYPNPAHLRTPEPLFHALNRLFHCYSDLKNAIEVKFIGDPKCKNIIDKYNLSDIVEEVGYLDRKSVIKKYFEADVLYLTMSLHKEYINAIPGKTYEYLRTGKYILAVIWESPTAEILKKFPQVIIKSPADIQGITDAILHLLELKKEESMPSFDFETPELIKYQKRCITGMLSGILDEVIKGFGRGGYPKNNEEDFKDI